MMSSSNSTQYNTTISVTSSILELELAMTDNVTLSSARPAVTCGPASTARAVLETASLFVIFGLSVVGNVLVCLVIHRSRRLQSTTNYFVISLAAADLVLSVVVMPFVLIQELAAIEGLTVIFVPPVSTCKFIRFCQQLVPASTSFVFFAISVDRFYAVVYPLRLVLTRGRAQRLVLVIWVLAAVLASPAVYFYGPDGSDGSRCVLFSTAISDGAAIIYVVMNTTLTFLLPAAVAAAVYTKVGKYIWRLGINGRTFQRTTNPVQRAKVKMVKMLMILNVVSVILMTPFFVVQLVYCWAARWHDGRDPYAAAVWLFFSSAAAKPLVYVTLNANFRRGCREVMCMSAMRCYRRHAYTITTTSTLAKKNHVGIATIAPSRSADHRQTPTELVVGSWPGSTGNVASDSTFLRRAMSGAPRDRSTTFNNYSRVLEPPERLRSRSCKLADGTPDSTYV